MTYNSFKMKNKNSNNIITVKRCMKNIISNNSFAQNIYKWK